jgi:hypothetical protein
VGGVSSEGNDMNTEYNGNSSSLTPEELSGWTYTLVMQGKKALELVRHNRPTNLVVAGRVIPLMLHCIAFICYGETNVMEISGIP